jgi:hypothetical protein
MMAVCAFGISFRASSSSVSSVSKDVIRHMPRCHPEGDVDVLSRHLRKPRLTWSSVSIVSMVGSVSRLAM